MFKGNLLNRNGNFAAVRVRESCGFDSVSRNGLFSFPRSDNKIKLGVEFRHTTHIASKIDQTGATECVNTRFPLSIL